MLETKSHRVLFVCRHNAVRSQIAEALMKHISRGRVETYSAGIEPMAVPRFVNTWASELYRAPTTLQSISLDELAGEHFDTIITLCDKSHAALAEHPGDRYHVRWDFHHPEDEDALIQLEIELSDRIRLFLQAHRL